MILTEAEINKIKMNVLLDLRGYKFIAVNDLQARWYVDSRNMLLMDVSVPADDWKLTLTANHKALQVNWALNPAVSPNIQRSITTLMRDYESACVTALEGVEVQVGQPVDKGPAEPTPEAEPDEEEQAVQPTEVPIVDQPEVQEPQKEEISVNTVEPQKTEDPLPIPAATTKPVQSEVIPREITEQIIKTTGAKVEITKNTKGYTWTVTVNSDTINSAVDQAIAADRRLKNMYEGGLFVG
jgi:hypothetical protein